MQAACAEMQSTDCPCFYQCRWAHGVVVSHPLRMRKALGSNPSVSILETLPTKCKLRFESNKQPLRLPTSCLSALALKQTEHKWTHWGLSPGPSACEADVIPLHHVPDEKVIALPSLWKKALGEKTLAASKRLDHSKTNSAVV